MIKTKTTKTPLMMAVAFGLIYFFVYLLFGRYIFFGYFCS